MNNEDIKRCLYPKVKNYNEVKDIMNKIKMDINILESMEEKLKEFPFYKEPGDTGKLIPSIYDVIKLHSAFDYLLCNSRGEVFNNLSSIKKIFNDSKDEIIDFIRDIMANKKTDKFNDIKINVVKGSIYKIKKYFLENDKIKDIRGGSTIIDYLNIEATENYMEENYIRECIIYAGGGNVFMIVPNGKGNVVCRELEELYSKVSLTAFNSFEYIECSLNEFCNNFKEVSFKLNEKLEERKKIKIYPINPDNDYNKIFNFKCTFLNDKNLVCNLCGIRDAKYILNEPEKLAVCPSCLRKHTAGRDKSIFYEEYENVTGADLYKNIKSLVDVADDRGYLAVVYGDGNNMGNVVKNVTNPFEMMYFSRKTEEITKNSVYNAIYEVMGDKAKFEAIALGGDDIFIVLPAEYSLNVAKSIVDKFDSAFNNFITMSVGICISHKNTPIKNMSNIAMSSLKKAKKKVKKEKLTKGTIDIEVLESNTNMEDDNHKKISIFPTDTDTLDKILKNINKMKQDKGIGRSQLYKHRYASSQMLSEEYQLFYMFQEFKNNRKLTGYINEIFNTKGSFTGLIKKGDQYYSPWEDITMLWDYSGGDCHEGN